MTAKAEKAPFLPYGRQTITDDDLDAIKEVLSGDLITRGPKVQGFEEAIASYCGANHAVAFSSGTAALQAVFHVSEVSAYDRIISSPNSFVASVIGRQQGAAVRFADIDRSTGNISLESLGEITREIHSRGKDVIVPVHFGGIAMNAHGVELHVTSPDTVIIEDACHAIGSEYPDGSGKVGNCAHSQMTVFSFHPVKTIAAAEGGMVTTNDPEIDRRLRRFRNNGMERDAQFLKEPSPGPWYYEVQELTGNYHMSDLHAALGLSQLSRIGDLVKKRRKLVAEYRKHLADVEGIRLFTDEFDAKSCFHLMIVQVDFEKWGISRADAMAKLREVGVGTQVHYIPLYRHGIFSPLTPEEREEQWPEMEAYYAQALTVPLYPAMKSSDVKRVCEALKALKN